MGWASSMPSRNPGFPTGRFISRVYRQGSESGIEQELWSVIRLGFALPAASFTYWRMGLRDGFALRTGALQTCEGWHSLPRKTLGLISSLIPHAFIFNVHCVLPGKRGGGGNHRAFETCFLRTAYRTLVINNVSQDSYFWSGLLGHNLLEVNSFILRLTVLPFPAERGEKRNHMFWGANGGNPIEDKWRLLSPGN